MKRGYVIFFLTLLVVCSSLVHAIDPNNIPLINQTKNVQEKIDDNNWNYTSDAWTSYLLKNEFIARANFAFNKLNFLFVFLLARDYRLSITLFFAFLFWIFTLLSLAQFRFFSRKEVDWIISVIVTIILAHSQIFNLIANQMYKAVFYKNNPLWSFMIFILMIVFTTVYLMIFRIFAKMFRQTKEKKELKKVKEKVDTQGKFIEGVEKGAS